jgi:cytochrome c-type biogenesis protein CcmE
MVIKKIHIIGLIMIGIAVALIVMASGDLSTYSTFESASQTTSEVKIVGQLSKDKEMYYNPIEDPNYFSFFMKDDKGVENKVVLLSQRPQDFELSEQIVATGKMKEDGVFYASSILMKCPSKYKDEEIYIKSEQSASL